VTAHDDQVLREIELVPLHPPEAPPPRARLLERENLLRLFARWRAYGFAVILPTTLAAIYFLFIAADRYEAEARFVVRSPNQGASINLSSMMMGGGGGGIVRSSDDAYVVHAYMRSRDAVRALAKERNLIALLQRDEADFMWAYPGLLRSESWERLSQHFQNFISIKFDTTTGITTLRVEAFRPDDAREIAEGLLSSAERLINSMSERANREMNATAASELELTRSKSQVALENITEFRRQNQLIDPSLMSKSSFEAITQLSLGIALTNAELKELQLIATQSPQIATLGRRIEAYNDQIEKERQALAGQEASLPKLIAEYERLVLEREFAERSFASARVAYDAARIEAERQRLFIERISSPTAADYPEYPHRLLGIVVVFVLAQILFVLGNFFLNDARSHAES